MGDPVRQRVGFSGPRTGDDEERCARRFVLLLHAVLDSSSLFGIEGVKIRDGHRLEDRSAAARPLNHDSCFVRNASAALIRSGRQGYLLARASALDRTGIAGLTEGQRSEPTGSTA